MNGCSLPTPIALYRPRWRRGLDALRAGLDGLRRRWAPAARAPGLVAVDELSESLLRDLGAPDWVRTQAAWRREGDSIALRAARAALGGDARW